MKSTFTLQLARDRNFLARELWRLESELLTRPELLLLKLGGEGAIPPDQALAFSDLIIAARNQGTRVLACAYNPLFGPDVALWLSADVRSMLPSAWIYIPSLKRYPDYDTSGELSLIPNVTVSESVSRLYDISYKEVLTQLDQYLPLSELFDRKVSARECRELGVTGCAMDRMLGHIEKGQEGEPWGGRINRSSL
jgi:hypothetical protein